MDHATPPTLRASLPELLSRARALLDPAERRILGITGVPGAGKSTLCAALAAGLGEQAVVVGMDGFHLANAELQRLGRRERKGAPDTFDAAGYAALLGRLRARTPEVVYAPVFDRHLEESIGSAQAVFPETPMILTEGNYLLLQEGAWGQVRGLLDQVWFLELPDELRLPRLIARHVAHGKSPPEAEGWVRAVDEGNAALIRASRSRADLIVQLAD